MSEGSIARAAANLKPHPALCKVCGGMAAYWGVGLCWSCSGWAESILKTTDGV